MKYYIIAGEKSGDLHASNLMKELKLRDENAEFRVWGGDEMKTAGGEIVRHFKETAFMGFAEVIANLPKIFGFIKECKKDIVSYKPDVVVLVDYAGFNLRIAKFAKSKGFRTFYYISPKVWAWNQKRAWKIKKSVDRMFVIMHFEQEFYQKFDYKVDYVGNPLFDAIAQFKPNPAFLSDNQLSEDAIIAVLPGSRKQEIHNMLSVMLEVRNQFPDYQFVIAGVDSVPEELYEPVREANLPIVFNQTYDLLAQAKSALVTSGTATLETALFNVPQVVCYKTSPISYSIAKRLIRVRYISLVNLIAQKETVKELIQNDFNVEKVAYELQQTLENPTPIKKDYAEMRAKIETEGTSKRTADLMWKYLNE